MSDSNILRKESTRWVATKTSYDGDDWGNEYEEDVTPVEPTGPTLEIPDSAMKSSPLKQVTEEEEGEETPNPNTESSNPTAQESKVDEPNQSNITETSNVSADHESDGEGETSIQEIYGFYEDRTQQHPYSAFLSGADPMATNEYSDSSASLSTGKFSAESALPDVQSSRKPLETRKNSQSTLERVDELQGGDQPSSTNENLSESKHGDTLDKKLSKLEINTNLDELNASGTKQDQAPRLEVLENEIAELYQGSSEFLKRPISTYQGSQLPSSFSDNSIKELLTPLSEQKEFETSFPTSAEIKEEEAAIKEVEPKNSDSTVSTAKPEDPAGTQEHAGTVNASDGLAAEKTEDPAPPVVVQEEHDVAKETSKSARLSLDPKDTESKKNDTYSPLGYVDYEVDRNSSTSSASSTGKPDADDVAFTLPSEKNKLTHSKNSESVDSKSTEFSNASLSRSRSLSSASSMHSVSSKEAPSMASSRITLESESDIDEKNATTSRSSRISDTLSSKTESFDGDSFKRDINEAFKDTATNLDDKKDISTAVSPAKHDLPVPNATEDRRAAPSGTQSIAAKVKRLPQLDFSALMNSTNMNSEARTDQLRLLRIRENEYSTGLEAWLATTLIQVDPKMKIYQNGMPPEATGLELDTAAKVSSVMHSSASNTMDKLAQVGEKSKSLGTKSKSFFAKVIR